MKRYAIIQSGAGDTVARYLPANYSVVATLPWEGRDVTVVEGRDEAGWTMDDYVLPRLASGLYFGAEVGLDHPIFKLIPEPPSSGGIHRQDERPNLNEGHAKRVRWHGSHAWKHNQPCRRRSDYGRL